MTHPDNPTHLRGQVALVTGASRGLGRAIALCLAHRGAKVAVNYFSNAGKADQLVKEITDAGQTAIAVQADVTDEIEIRNLVKHVHNTLGPIDILVLNATGPQPFIPIEKVTWEDYMNQINFFIKSPLLLVQQVIGHMKQQRAGRIINIGSEVFETAPAEFANYVSAKGAQLGLTRSWAREFAPWQITVNLVAPGWIPTERHADDPQQLKDEYAQNVPMKHMGEHHDIGEAVAFLASPAAGFITGQKISVNGGNTFE